MMDDGRWMSSGSGSGSSSGIGIVDGGYFYLFLSVCVSSLKASRLTVHIGSGKALNPCVGFTFVSYPSYHTDRII